MQGVPQDKSGSHHGYLSLGPVMGGEYVPCQGSSSTLASSFAKCKLEQEVRSLSL